MLINISQKTIILFIAILLIVLNVYFVVGKVLGVTIGGNLDMANNRIVNLGTPSLTYDATTKSYVDSAINALKRTGTIANGLIYCSTIDSFGSYFRCNNPRVRYWYNGAERDRDIAAFSGTLQQVCLALRGYYYTYTQASRTQQYYAFFQTYGDDYYRWQDYSNPNYYITSIYCYYQ